MLLSVGILTFQLQIRFSCMVGHVWSTTPDYLIQAALPREPVLQTCMLTQQTCWEYAAMIHDLLCEVGHRLVETVQAVERIFKCTHGVFNLN